jgi:hypothetical protein
MNELAQLCFNWAQQFALDGIHAVSYEGVDQGYGDYVQIKIEPETTIKPMADIIVTQGTLGFTIESWRRLHVRIYPDAGMKEITGIPDRVGAFIEPGVISLDRCAGLLDAVALGHISCTVNTFMGRIASTRACISVDHGSIFLNGPSLGGGVLQAICGVKTHYLKYSEWSASPLRLSDSIKSYLTR